MDAAGDIYLTGYTHSLNFPSVNAFRPKTVDGGSADAYVVKFTPGSNAFQFATCFGGTAYDFAFGIKVDAAGYAHVIGYSESTDLPLAAPNQSYAGARDAFALKLAPTGSSVAYATYLGGSAMDEGRDIALDSDGAVYLTGETSSTNFPVVSAYSGHGGGADAFLTKLDDAGAIVYSTYLGGSGADHGWGVAVNSQKQPHVIGYTASANFPVQRPVQQYRGGDDVFVTKFDATASQILFSTHLGGTLLDYGRRGALTSLGGVYVSGETTSTNFPLVNALHGDKAGWDVFVARLDPVSVASVTPAFALPAGGTPVVVAGSGFEPGASVFFGETAATEVIVDSDGTVRATAPPAAAPGNVDILLRNADGTGSVLRAGFEYSPDSDGDGVADRGDNCPAVANHDQADLDADGIGNVCRSRHGSDRIGWLARRG